MGAMKRFAEQVSVELGQGGEITSSVLREAQKRLRRMQQKAEKKSEVEIIEALHHSTLRCTDHDNETLTPETYAGLFDGDPLCKEARRVREEFLSNVQ